ncbi:(2Fe-2S)-binding protein [Psychrilyobacter atlanticus]|uniref:(2Fe-2S)-binding protein n=1 Tax=Psychrilyobacter atlanticus TaxID=271091 RepID=UPI0004236FCB|nr:(2Fe-2S)-binding protein [Psychrilyobacter atlanticus]
MRVVDHPILGEEERKEYVTIYYNGKPLNAMAGETIAATLMSAGIRKFRKTPKYKRDRGVYCGIGRCTDCVMVVNGKPNVRTCVTPVEEGMSVETQIGYGKGEE